MFKNRSVKKAKNRIDQNYLHFIRRDRRDI